MNIIPIGKTTSHSSGLKFGIKSKDRRHHMYVIGQTGTGKSTLLKNMAIRDMREGHGVALIDPHGELVEDILHFVPRSRLNEVVYFNPSDIENPIGLNILEAKDDEQKQLVASSLISIFKHLWKEFWGPRLEHVFHNAILALMETPDSTLLGIYRMLADEEYRKGVVSRVRDPVVRLFWEEDFEKYPAAFKKEVTAPIQNKIGQLLTSTPLRNIIGQTKSTIDLRFIMDNKRILLVNLAKGRIGEDKANLLGSVLVTKLYLAALERQDTREEERKDFELYIDEFQNFSTDIFPSILSEARKYRLCLTLAHQYLYQLSESVKHSVFGNVGTLVAFRVGSLDAMGLAEEFKPDFTSSDLEHAENYHAYIKLMIDGKRSKPFSMETLPPLPYAGDEAQRDTLIRVSRERFASRREDIADKIEKWFSK
ncbi:MAG: type IV secretory system conjugative DNA transfer family protein [Minisyncoccota bacterium]